MNLLPKKWILQSNSTSPSHMFCYAGWVLNSTLFEHKIKNKHGIKQSKGVKQNKIKRRRRIGTQCCRTS